MVALWEEGLGVLQRALWSQEQVSRGPDGLPNPPPSPQAAALHSQLHPHQSVRVFHAAGGSHPHPRQAAASPWPLPRGPGSSPLEPGERHSPLLKLPPQGGGEIPKLFTTSCTFGEGPPQIRDPSAVDPTTSFIAIPPSLSLVILPIIGLF